MSFLSDVRVTKGNRQGIPTIEITIGDYLRDWEKQILIEKMQIKMAEARLRSVQVIEDKREDGKFRAYVVESSDSTEGFL